MGIHHDRLSQFAAGELAIERAQIHALRGAILQQIDEDMRQVDRCIAILDAMDGDADLCADYTTVEQLPDGRLFTLGRSSDEEEGDDAEVLMDGKGIADTDSQAEERLDLVASGTALRTVRGAA